MEDYSGVERRDVHPISDADVEKIATSIIRKTRHAFYIDDKSHYDSHKRLDQVLEAFDNARNIFWKSFLALVIVGAIVLAGFSASKGLK